jgi:hypothetical protein
MKDEAEAAPLGIIKTVKQRLRGVREFFNLIGTGSKTSGSFSQPRL